MRSDSLFQGNSQRSSCLFYVKSKISASDEKMGKEQKKIAAEGQSVQKESKFALKNSSNVFH